MDIRLPDVDGIELLKEFSGSGVKFIVITGYGDVKTAVQCMKLGACDFIQKPFNFELLEVTIRKALKGKRLEEENKALKSFLFKEKEGDYLLETRSERFRKVLDIARKVANTDVEGFYRKEVYRVARGLWRDMFT